MLLDTHTAWWVIRKPQKLGKAFIRKLDRNRTAFFSPLSIFELLQKNAKQNMGVPANLQRVFLGSGLAELHLTGEHAANALNFNHQLTDPFDRLLLAQAEFEQIDFYTQDSKILSMGLNFVKDAGL